MIRWLTRSRLSMQRLGFCKAAVLLSGSVSSSGELAQLMRENLEARTVKVPGSPDLDAWLARRRNQVGAEMKEGSSRAIPLQDYYVRHHPSRTGWLSREAFNEYAEYLARRLGFLDDAFRRTEAGDLLVDVLMRSDEREGFEQGEPRGNILILDTRQRVLFLYQLLAADGDFLVPYAGSIASRFGTSQFSYLEAGELLPGVCREVARTFSGYTYTADDREMLDKLNSTATRIEKHIAESIEKQGSGSRREQTSIPRLEWLIDLGLAKRQPTEDSARVFALTEQGRMFSVQASSLYAQYLSTRYADNALMAVLDDHFYDLVSQLYFGGKAEPWDEGDPVDFLRPAFDALSKLRGYYLLRPLLLLANLNALQSELPRFLEYSKVRDLLETAYQAAPDRFSYTIDRFATDYQLRILD